MAQCVTHCRRRMPIHVGRPLLTVPFKTGLAVVDAGRVVQHLGRREGLNVAFERVVGCPNLLAVVLICALCSLCFERRRAFRVG